MDFVNESRQYRNCLLPTGLLLLDQNMSNTYMCTKSYWLSKFNLMRSSDIENGANLKTRLKPKLFGSAQSKLKKHEYTYQNKWNYEASCRVSFCIYVILVSVKSFFLLGGQSVLQFTLLFAHITLSRNKSLKKKKKKKNYIHY